LDKQIKISSKAALKLVRDLKGIINHDLTFMDTSAHIIACTVESRIGDFHGATRKMLDENLSSLVVTSNNEYEGTCEGVNLTIEIEGQIVAVLGITGEYDKVEKFAQIIKRITEILLLEEVSKSQKRSTQDAKNRFVYEWIFSHTDWMNKDFYYRGLNLGIDISIPRRVVVSSSMWQYDKQNIRLLEDNWEMLEPVVKNYLKSDKRNIWLLNGYKLIILLVDTKDYIIRSMIEDLQVKIKEKCGTGLCYGIDSTPTWSEYTHGGYARAEKALLSCYNALANETAFYGDINVEIFINEISDASKQEFIGKIFKDCTKQEISEWCYILNTLYQCNGSIGKTADLLFLHKNTLQYKLNKLKSYSGYDPRALGDSSLFYIAIVLWNSLNI